MKLCSLFCILFFSLGFSHHGHLREPDPGHSHQGAAFDEGPRQFAKIIAGAGDNIHFQADQCTDEAKAFINQGIGQLHGFLNFESERSFRHAAFLDNTCALAFWGMAMANTVWAPNPTRAAAFTAEARNRLQAEKDERTQLYVESLEALHQSNNAVGYLEKLREVWQRFPDDLDAKAFFMVEIWARKLGNQLNYDNMDIDRLARDILSANPKHPVHHYVIHLWDNPYDYENAIFSADQSGFAAPSVAHLWHMAGHTYSQGKMYFEKWWSQEASARVDHLYMKDMKVFPFMLHNHAHNNEWLTRTLMDLSAFDKALRVSLNLLMQPTHPIRNTGMNDYGHLQHGLNRSLEALERGDYWELAAKMIATPVMSCIQFESPDLRNKCIRIGKLAEIFTGQSLALPETFESEIGNEIENVSQLMNGDASAYRRLKRMAQLQSSWGLYNLVKYGYKAGFYEDAADSADELIRQDSKNSAFLLLSSAVFAKAGNTQKAQTTFKQAQAISQIVDLESPINQSISEVLRSTFSNLAEDWRQPFSAWREVHASRPQHEDMGPLLWQPFTMENVRWIDKTGKWHDLRAERGSKPSVVVFLLADCPQCDAQYKKLEKYQPEFDALGVSLVAVTYQQENMPAFKSVGAYDDFESMPIHGLFVVNAQNEIVWQELSASAFMDIEFLMKDLKRLVHPDHRLALTGILHELN